MTWWWLGFTIALAFFSFYLGAAMASGEAWPFKGSSERKHAKLHARIDR